MVRICTFLSSATIVLSVLLPGCGDDDGAGNQNNNQNSNQNDNRPVICGDGRLEGAEECDHGTANSDTLPDACRTGCTLPTCGDEVTDLGAGEQCDDGAANSDTGPDSCRTSCTLPSCGDGVIDPGLGELCDDGAANSEASNAACRSDCQPARCGDGVQDSGEECDLGHFNSDDTPNACRTNCLAPHCGDGVVEDWEVCDDGGNESGDGCSADCASDETCGNGIMDLGEECDAGVYNAALPNAPCRLACLQRRCGDGVVDDLDGEVCDDAANNSDIAPDACRESCQPARCGDGVIDTGEQCDDGNPQDGDGCSGACRLEYGWNCTSAQPTQCMACPAHFHGVGCDRCAVLVDVSAPTPVGNGASWPTAYRSVQEGIDYAHGLGAGCEVWVARGNYAIHRTHQTDSVTLRDGVAVLGGFAGGETARAQRDVRANVSVLDGSDGHSQLFVYHVVTAVDTLDATLDGLVITNGQAAGAEPDGGGLWLSGSSVTVHNCLITGNVASRQGGGIYVDDSPLLLSDSLISGNFANLGGGMANHASAAAILRSSFVSNTAGDDGGGLYILDAAAATVTDATFLNNTTLVSGGGIYNEGIGTQITQTRFLGNRAQMGGGVFNEYDDTASLQGCLFQGNYGLEAGGIYVNRSSPTLTDCVFRENTAEWGGAMTVDRFPIIEGCSFLGNWAAYDGGALYVFSGSTYRHCVFTDNRAEESGGAIFNYGGAPIIEDTLFNHNSAGTAGALFEDGQSRITRSVFTGNTADWEGGAIYLRRGSNAQVTSSVFAGNQAGDIGGAVADSYQAVTAFVGDTFVGNVAAAGGALWLYSSATSVQTLTNSVLWLNAPEGILGGGTLSVTYSDIQGAAPFPGPGNVLTDPGFVADPTTPLVQGDWESVSFDSAAYQTVLTDQQGAFTPGALRGLFVQPELGSSGQPTEADPRWFLVVDNTGQEIRVWGDLSAFPWTGDRYAIYDLHLRADSQCVDAGFGCATAGGCDIPPGSDHVPETPATDLDGVARHDVSGVSNDGSGIPDYVDLGAYERQ